MLITYDSYDFKSYYSEIICKCLSFYLKLFIYIFLEYEGGVMFKRIRLFSQIFKQNKLYFSIK